MKHTKFILGTIFGIMISASIAVFALNYYATDITYKNKTVDAALNELYKLHGNSYGIVRELSTSSSKWIRTGESVGLVANANVGTTAVRNDFDNIYPWSDIITVDLNHDGTENSRYDGTNEWFTNATGEIMTYIPEFYYKRDQVGGYEYILISPAAKEGYIKSDAFYIGRYAISEGTHSKCDVKPQVSKTVTDFRTGAKALGSGWQLMDYHYFIIQLLYLVEYADYNSQSMLGQGSTNSSALIASGGCNALGMKSGMMAANNTSSVIYRGIEDLYGNAFQYVDGINVSGTKAYISYDPSKYAVDNFNDGYYEINYSLPSTNGFISKLGYDPNHPLISLPNQANGTVTTYITDKYNQVSGNRIALVGGQWNISTSGGLWFWSLDCTSSCSWSTNSARLLKIN